MADRPTVDPESAQADRWHRREHLGVLLSRAARGVLTPKEGPLLRAAVDTELADAEDAHRRAERAEQQAANVRAVLAEVLAQFVHDTHPGAPCKQTGHVNVATINRWRAALDTAGQPDTSEAGR